MTSRDGRRFLVQAKNNKKDEFYTQRSDIDRELAHYDKRLFKGKVVYCNTDDPLKSNFVRFFIDNFAELGLKRLVATSLAAEGDTRGRYFSYEGQEEQLMKFRAGEVGFLKGNGDFRSSECLELLDEADIVVTNPPFSLLRSFISHLDLYGKKFLIIATINAITYKEVFKLIQENRIWLGFGLGRAISGFIVPDHYALYGTETQINAKDERIVATNNALWLTNLDVSKRHEFLPLVKTYKGSEINYPKYENLDAINVDRTNNIPSDWYGLMGVPITFLHKHNPEQFELVGFRKGDDGKDLRLNGKTPYFRVVIRRI